MKKKDFIKTISKYSLLFMVLISIILFIFSFYGKSFVWVNVSNDGLDQHLINLHLFKGLLLDFIKTHTLNTFFWQVGYGMDMFANFSYYVFGDFLSYISVWVPDNQLDILYNILVVLRLYLVGISFLIYCNYKKLDSFSSLVGAIMYTFSFYALFAMARHPYFINALTVFPLVLMFTERIIKEDKKVGFTIMVAILFITSFYFGYMIALLMMVYGVILIFCEYKKNYGLIFKKLLITFMCAVVGLMISSIIVFPTINAFLDSTRSDSHLYLYSLQYYKNLVSSLLSIKNVGNWSLIGVSSLFLVFIPTFIRNKSKYKTIYIFISCAIVPLIIPFIGSVLAGFSYPNNRWSFVISFFFSLVVTLMLNGNLKIKLKEIVYFLIIYTGLILLINQQLNVQMIVSLLCALFFAWILNNRVRLQKKFNYLLISILIINIGFNIYYLYDINGFGYVEEFVEKNPDSLYSNANYTIPYLEEAMEYLKTIDDDYYNVLIYPDELYNLSLINDYQSISYFYSIVSGNYLQLATDLENQELGINKEIKNFNYRTNITTLLNNKYLITTDKSYVPYGYYLIKNYNDETYIYKNNYNLSFASLYTSKINRNLYNELSPLEKEVNMLQATVLDEEYFVKSRLDENNTIYNIENIGYKTIGKNIKNNRITIEDESDEIKIVTDNILDKEVYLYIKNIEFKNKKNDSDKFTINVSVGEKSISEKRESSVTSAYYFENNDILINLGYYEDFFHEITLTFNSVGIYTFESMEILTLDFDEYKIKTKELRKSNFVLESIDNNYISGTINAAETGVLQFATNYSQGWHIYVDGIEVETFTSNNYFLGIDIEKGFHEVMLIYKTPGLKVGKYISFVGLLLLGGLILTESNFVKKRK